MLMSLPMGTGTCREKEKTMAASLAEASWWTGAIKTERSYIRPMAPEVKELLDQVTIKTAQHLELEEPIPKQIKFLETVLKDYVQLTR